MSRPKGSKNKKTLLAEAQLGERIAESEAVRKKLQREEQRLTDSLENVKARLRITRKELRSVERALSSMRERKEQVDFSVPYYTATQVMIVREDSDIATASDMADKKNATNAQISLAWMLHKYPHVVPIPGSKNQERILENLGAWKVALTDDEFRSLEDALNSMAIHGQRRDLHAPTEFIDE